MNAPDLFTRWAEFYDRLYAYRGKDYAKESEYLLNVLRTCGFPRRQAVLDAGCGTGGHLIHLRNHFEVEGVDCNPAMLAVARSRLPGVMLHEQDMTALDLSRQYDVICCLFGSINYLADEDALNSTIVAMVHHLKPNGILLIEPALLPERMQPPGTDVMRIDEPDLCLTRRMSGAIDGNSLVITFDFDIEIPAGVKPFREIHTIHLFERLSFKNALGAAGLSAHFDLLGPAGNGLFIAARS